MNEKQKPFVSVIMPVRNEADFIRTSLGAVLNQDYPRARMEVLVVDGDSEDKTPEILEEFRKRTPGLVTLKNTKKIVAAGLNQGIRAAKGEIIVRVDGHCVIEPGYVSECVRALETKQADGVGGSISTIGETLMAKAIAIAMSSRFGVGGSAFRVVKGREMPVETVPFPAYYRALFDKIGFFDEELVRNQDDEFNYRLKKPGGKILLSPAIRSSYYSRSSLSGLWRQYFQYGFWKVRVFQKHPKQMQWRQFVPPLFVFLLSLSAAAWLCNPSLLFLAAPGIYLASNFLASVFLSAKNGWKYALFLPVIFFILHFSYGLGFWTGMVKFSNRWKESSGGQSGV
jgi:succinoglycan biosynthesis protein ExoA